MIEAKLKKSQIKRIITENPDIECSDQIRKLVENARNYYLHLHEDGTWTLDLDGTIIRIKNGKAHL